MIEALGLSEAGLRRIIATNAPGHLKLKDWDNDINAYAEYLGRKATVKKVKRAKFARKKTAHKLYSAAPPPRPKILKNVQDEIHSLLCTNSKKYEPIRTAFFGKGKHSQTAVVSSIASVVASTSHVALGLAVSLVAVCLLAACKVGVNAYCRFYEEKKRLPEGRKKMKVPAKKVRKTAKKK
jgi:hypothetical protein